MPNRFYTGIKYLDKKKSVTYVKSYLIPRFAQRKHRRRKLPTNNNPHTMAAATGNGPLAPQKRPTFQYDTFNRWRTMPRSSEYAFRRRWVGQKPPKRSDGKARFIAIIASPPERFKGLRPDHPGEKHMLLIGASYPIDTTLRRGFFYLNMRR